MTSVPRNSCANFSALLSASFPKGDRKLEEGLPRIGLAWADLKSATKQAPLTARKTEEDINLNLEE